MGCRLFVEELTKMVVESGLLTRGDGHYELTGPLPPLAIPTTLTGFPDGPAGSAGHGERDCPAGSDPGAGVFL